MSERCRAGYAEDNGEWALIRWRGMIASATRGKRGQAFFRSLVEALDAMPVKELIAYELVKEGGVCALGALGRARGLTGMEDIDPEDPDTLAGWASLNFDIAEPLAREVVYMNDNYWWDSMHPAERWRRMRGWAAAQIRNEESRKI